MFLQSNLTPRSVIWLSSVLWAEYTKSQGSKIAKTETDFLEGYIGDLTTALFTVVILKSSHKRFRSGLHSMYISY
jgi:hypothetical protein